MKKILLHICCGVCGLQSIRALKDQGYKVEGFFYNPNIYPLLEYELRKNTAKKVCAIEGIVFIDFDYRPKDWDEVCQKFPDEPEGNGRCKLCYELRLKKTYEVARIRGFDLFTTTLTISPHKRSNDIFEIASSFAKKSFFAIDFKKNQGFKKAIDLAKQHDLYRQNYCGCSFSLKERSIR